MRTVPGGGGASEEHWHSTSVPETAAIMTSSFFTFMTLQQKKRARQPGERRLTRKKELMALAVHGLGVKNNASVGFAQRDGLPLRLRLQFLAEGHGTDRSREWCPVWQAPAPHWSTSTIRASWSQSIRICFTFCTWPLVAPLCQISWRLRE